MMDKNNKMTATDQAAIMGELTRFSENEALSLEEGLAQMAMRDGMSAKDSVSAASTIIQTIKDYEDTCNQVQEDPEAILRELFDALEKEEPAKRLQVIRQLHFSLLLHTDQDMLQKMEMGISADELFNAKYGDMNVYTESEDKKLRSEIAEMVNVGKVAPEALERMFDAIDALTGDYTAVYAASGRDGMQLKAVTAMHLYLSSKDQKGTYTCRAEEATLMACQIVEVQAVEDGVLAGHIGVLAAQLLIFGKMFSIMIKAAKLVLAGATLSKLFSILAVAAFLVLMLNVGMKFIPRWVGMATTFSYVKIKEGVEKVKAMIAEMREQFDISTQEEHTTEAAQNETVEVAKAMERTNIKTLEQYI